MSEMDEKDAPPSAEELAEAEALRDALADPSRANRDAEFARAVALGHSPRAIDASEHRAIVERAVAKMPAKNETKSGGRVIRVVFGVSAAVALAASVILAIGRVDERSMQPSAASLVQARSTQSLFAEPFAREGGESARIDRIAMARAQDYRDNQFAAWGVR